MINVHIGHIYIHGSTHINPHDTSIYRAPAANCLNFFYEFNDTGVRDIALDTIYWLLNSSIKVQKIFM